MADDGGLGMMGGGGFGGAMDTTLVEVEDSGLGLLPVSRVFDAEGDFLTDFFLAPAASSPCESHSASTKADEKVLFALKSWIM